MDKQEVIEILWDKLKNAAHYGENYVNGINIAEQLYARIAPLREFPEEEFHALLLRFNGMDTASAWLDDCKRLWEGTDCDYTGERRVGERRVNDEKYWPPGFGRRIKGSDDDRRFYTTRKVDEIIKHEMGGFPYSACKYVPLGRRSNGKSRRKGVTTRRDGEERRKGEKS